MATPVKRSRLEKAISVVVLGAIIWFVFYLFVVTRWRYAAATPPATIETLDDFITWKGDELRGRGKFRQGGQTYTVLLAPPGRTLESGPAAYLFDGQGNFVDWTFDMGDVYTEKHGFDLTSGGMKIDP